MSSGTPEPGGGRVQAEHLHLVGAVQPGGANADEDLADPRLGVGVVGDDDLPVADGGGAHGYLLALCSGR